MSRPSLLATVSGRCHPQHPAHARSIPTIHRHPRARRPEAPVLPTSPLTMGRMGRTPPPHLRAHSGRHAGRQRGRRAVGAAAGGIPGGQGCCVCGAGGGGTGSVPACALPPRYTGEPGAAMGPPPRTRHLRPLCVAGHGAGGAAGAPQPPWPPHGAALTACRRAAQPIARFDPLVIEVRRHRVPSAWLPELSGGPAG